METKGGFVVMNGTPIMMEEVMDYLGINYRYYSNGNSVFNLPCPQCDNGERKRHLNENLEKGKWR